MSCCGCKRNDCLSMNCPCFREGQYCRCRSKACCNKAAHEEERRKKIEELLKEDPMAFTPDETITYDNVRSISDFAVLMASVDNEEFPVEPCETALSSLTKSDIVNQATITIVSSVNSVLEKPEDVFEEAAENAIALEFEKDLEIIKTAAQRQ